MKIEINQNNLLTISNENIPQTKEYTYNASGYTFSDYDKWIIVLHKKEWKIVNLKNLWDNMNVVYIKSQNETYEFNEVFFNKTLCLFKWFDETKWIIYNYIPWYWEQQIQKMNNMLNTLNIKTILQKTNKGCEVKNNSEAFLFSSNIKKLEDWKNVDNISFKNEDILNILFALLLFYGKFEGKNKELSSIKIQIPLAGQYMKEQEELNNIVHLLQKKWIFLKTSKQTTNDGIIYQISSNDYELLEIFAKWYEPVEKFEKITKREFTQEMKTKLIEFIKNNPEIPQEGKDEVLKQIQTETIKLLTK